MPVIGNQGGGGGLILDSNVQQFVSNGSTWTVPAGKVFRGQLLSGDNSGTNIYYINGDNVARGAVQYQGAGDTGAVKMELGPGGSVTSGGTFDLIRITGALYTNA